LRKEDQEGIVKKEDQEGIVKKEDQEEIVKIKIHAQALQNEEKTSLLKKLIKVKNVHQLKKIAALINLL